MFCDNCGRVFEKGEDICQGCGAPVKHEISPEPKPSKAKKKAEHE